MKNNKKLAIAYLHTHWDPEWYKTEEGFNVRLIEIFDKVLKGLQSGEIPSFYFDGQTLALLNYLKFRPEKKRLITKFIKEKKLFIGPFFVSADNLLVSGASLIKNLEIGLKISRKFGQNEFLGYLSDTFGHSEGIFKILKLFEIENAILWRGVPEMPSDFIANGIKTTRLVYGYYQDVLLSDNTVSKKADILENILDKIAEHSKDVLLLPLGGDHLPPPDDALELINKINKHLKKYTIKLGNPFEYISLADYTKAKHEGEFLDNSQTYILQGVYSARIDEKIKNAKLQWELFHKACVFDYFTGKKHKAELDFTGIQLIKNHAHDSIYGCSTDEVNLAVKNRQQKIEETIKAVKKSSFSDFKKKNLINDTVDSIGIFNLSNFEQTGVISVISDKKIKNGQMISKFFDVSDDIMYDIQKNPMTEDFHNFYEYLIEIDKIKPFSFKNLKILPPVKKHAIGKDFIENSYFKLCINENKIYLIDKKTGKIHDDFISVQSVKDEGDSYNFAPAGYYKTLNLKTTKIKTEGKIKSALQLIYEENIKLNISLTNNSKLLYMDFDFINKKKNRKLQISFNTGSPVLKTTAEDSMGLIKREHNPNYLLFEQMPVKDKSELKTNSYPMQRFAEGNGITVFTKGLNEYEIYKNELKVTFLRSTGIISNPKNKARKVPAGPPIECPDMQEIGKHKIELALGLDLENNEKYALADNFYGPFEGILGEFKFKNKTYLKSRQNAIFTGIFSISEKTEKPLFTNNE